MGALESLLTGNPVDSHGIYQSVCGCRTALTLLVGQTLPRCLGCDDIVEWRLVQEVRPSQVPSSSGSSSRFRAVRPPRDSASGED